jgi:hypothetical protein
MLRAGFDELPRWPGRVVQTGEVWRPGSGSLRGRSQGTTGSHSFHEPHLPGFSKVLCAVLLRCEAVSLHQAFFGESDLFKCGTLLISIGSVLWLIRQHITSTGEL